jgi:hypothetical protein
MSMDSTSTWFVRLPSADWAGAACPSCRDPYQISPVFVHDEVTCRRCKTALVEWHIHETVYLIDVQKAPSVVRAIVDHLGPLSRQEAWREMEQLLLFLEIKSADG